MFVPPHVYYYLTFTINLFASMARHTKTLRICKPGPELLPPWLKLKLQLNAEPAGRRPEAGGRS